MDVGDDERPPWAVRLYFLLAAAIAFAVASMEISKGRPANGVLALAVVVSIAALVYRRSRIAWILVVAAAAIGLASGTITPQPLLVVAIEATNLLLLILPSSFRFVWGGAADRLGRAVFTPSGRGGRDGLAGREEDEQSFVPDALSYEDRERPAGWYVDPQSPKRMRYWSEADGWMGDTRTPRALQKEWERGHETK